MKVYLHETMRTVPGNEERYMASVLAITQRPGRAEREDHRQLGLFRTAEASGRWPMGVNLWEHSWESQAEALSLQFGDSRRDTAMEDWWQRNLHLRRGGYDRLLVPAAYTPDAAALEESGVRGRVFLQEILWLPFGKASVYLEALEERFLPSARRYRWQLVGAYRVAMRPRQVLTLFAFRDWADLAKLLAARESDADLRGWFAWRDALTDDLEELVLLPGRLNPLGIRD